MKYVLLGTKSELKEHLIQDIIGHSFSKLCMDISMNGKELMILPTYRYGEKDFADEEPEKTGEMGFVSRKIFRQSTTHEKTACLLNRLFCISDCTVFSRRDLLTG